MSNVLHTARNIKPIKVALASGGTPSPERRAFNAAFALARAKYLAGQGPSTFPYKGALYGVQLANKPMLQGRVGQPANVPLPPERPDNLNQSFSAPTEDHAAPMFQPNNWGASGFGGDKDVSPAPQSPMATQQAGPQVGGNAAPMQQPNNYGGGYIQNLITKLAQEGGVDPKYMLAVAKQESDFNPNAQAKIGSAGGLFQFIDKTWEAYGKGDKYDPVANTQAAIKFTKDNQNYLSKRGVEPTPGATYLAHFFGAGGATSVLKNPNDLVSDHLSAKAIKANPSLAGKTGSDMLSWAEKKMNYSPTPSSVGNLAPKPAPAPSQTPTFMKTGSSDMAPNG